MQPGDPQQQWSVSGDSERHVGNEGSRPPREGWGVPSEPYGQPPEYGPAPEYGQQPEYGQRPGYGASPGYAPGYGSTPGYGPSPGYGPAGGFGASPGYGVRGAPGPDVRRGRVWLIALTAFLVELIVIAAACNQTVSKHVSHYAYEHQNRFANRAAQALLTYTWRVSPAKGDNHGGVHIWWAQLTGLVVLFVITAALVVAVCRGAITFGRAFFGTWMAVICATVVGLYAGGLVTKNYAFPGANRVTAAVFYYTGGAQVFAAVVLGFVVALITGLVAIASRRRPAPLAAPFGAPEPQRGPGPEAAPGYGEAPEPFFGTPEPRHATPAARPDTDDATSELPSLQKAPAGDSRIDHGGDVSPASGTERLPSLDDLRDQGADGEEKTTQLPRFPGAAEHTAQFERAPASDGASAAEPTGEPSREPSRGPSFPRPPDDEELGQHPE